VVICKDCTAEWIAKVGIDSGPPRNPRPVVPDSGKRCATHWRAEKKRRKAAAAENRNQKVYGLPAGAYEALYTFQGGKCAICRRATGATRRLAVDHDHKTGLVRMLACGPCNKILGHFRDSPELLRAAADTLEHPPAARLGLIAIHKENRDESD